MILLPKASIHFSFNISMNQENHKDDPASSSLSSTHTVCTFSINLCCNSLIFLCFIFFLWNILGGFLGGRECVVKLVQVNLMWKTWSLQTFSHYLVYMWFLLNTMIFLLQISSLHLILKGRCTTYILIVSFKLVSSVYGPIFQ